MWGCDNRGKGEREEKREVYCRRGGLQFSGESYLIGE